MESNREVRYARQTKGIRTLLKFIPLIMIIVLVACNVQAAPGEPPQDVQALIDQALRQTRAVETGIAEAIAETLAAGNPTGTPTQISYPVPDILEQALVEPRIYSVETFDAWTGEDWSYVTDNISVVNDGGNTLRLPGLTDWGTIAVFPAFRQGQGALIRFKLSGPNYRIEFHLIQNEWDTPAYKRYGGVLYDEDRMKTAIYEGTDDHLYNQVMDGSLVFGPDRWYGLFIGADKSGGFRFVAWDWEDPSQFVWHEFQRGSAWANGEWRLEVPVDTGTVFLDDFSIVSFDGFGPFPNTDGTPPPPPAAGTPTVQVSVDTNCRTGPGEPFPSVGSLMIGETAEVVGRSPGGDFWIIKNLDAAGTCWLWKQYATVTGDTSKLPIIQPPPTPTPSPLPYADLTIENGIQGKTVCAVYIAFVSDSSWGNNLLPSHLPEKGQSYTFTLPVGKYKVHAEECNGNWLSRWDEIDLYSDVTLKVVISTGP